MIEKFFQGLNSSEISYLLISGQATVLYGAATFSEDVDLWIKPKIDNWNKFIKLLKSLDARIYKLTPPISMEHIQEGHGFHFQLPAKDEKLPFWFLDVMGVVPRTRSFAHSFKNATYQKTDWGKISVIGIRDLVEIKKTKRLEDYAVISNLVRIEYDNLNHKKINLKDWKWILENSFEVEDILYYLSRHNLAKRVCKLLSRPCVVCCLKAITNSKNKDKYIESASKKIALEIEAFRKKDRKYWEPIINKLKDMKQKNQLLITGSSPSRFV